MPGIEHHDPKRPGILDVIRPQHRVHQLRQIHPRHQHLVAHLLHLEAEHELHVVHQALLLPHPQLHLHRLILQHDRFTAARQLVEVVKRLQAVHRDVITPVELHHLPRAARRRRTAQTHHHQRQNDATKQPAMGGRNQNHVSCAVSATNSRDPTPKQIAFRGFSGARPCPAARRRLCWPHAGDQSRRPPRLPLG